MNKILDYLGLLFYCLFIYWLSDQQTLPTPDLFENQDKVLHFGAYFVMGIFAWRSFKHITLPPIILALITIAFCSLYALSDEWHQSFVPGRSSDVLDWIADTLGASFSVFLLYKLRKYGVFRS
jgi:VanZ family protein